MNIQRTMNTKNKLETKGKSFRANATAAIGRHAAAISLLVPLWMPASASAGTDFQPLEQTMTKEERNRSGVDSLSAEQRKFLNNWLRQRYGPDATNMREETDSSADTTVQLSERSSQEKVIEAEVERRVAKELATRKQPAKAAVNNGAFEATLVGDFTGWRGKTVFRLDNGQIWRQRSSSQYRHRGSDQRVKFDKNWMGGWEMTVVSSGKSVLVSKVR
ncbi:hypothetical protein OMB55_00025110 [gamma proteobacterium HIMB55]|nr:hypothetical protein OMB55_00025110 [gamma proteobacterium HIMB55]